MSERNQNDLGTFLRERRIAARLGLRETARLIEISPAYLSRIETRAELCTPSEAVLRRLATLLSINFDLLMTVAKRLPASVVELTLRQRRAQFAIKPTPAGKEQR